MNPKTTTTLLQQLRDNPALSNMSHLFEIGEKSGVLNDTTTLTTLFAPNNSAFEVLSKSAIKKLFHPTDLAYVKSVLLYHCAFGEILSTALKPIQNIETLYGLEVTITRNSSNVIRIGNWPNFAQVVHRDLVSSNGVMDIIDTVLLPGAQPTPSGPTPSPAHPTPSAPTPGAQYYCQVPQYKCASIAGGQFPSQAACQAKCRLPTPPTPPTPAPPPPPPTPQRPTPAPTRKTHYGDPAAGCLAGEVNATITGVAGDLCAPDCTSTACPTDKPAGVTATGLCLLRASTVSRCALVCSPYLPIKDQKAADAQCGTATCKPILHTGICTYSD
jgi:uncharacterized surface protein with fasciclin (FAS1) repeats